MPSYIPQKFSAKDIMELQGAAPEMTGREYNTILEANRALRAMHSENEPLSMNTYGLFQTVRMPEVAVVLEQGDTDRRNNADIAAVGTMTHIAKDAIHPMSTHEGDGLDMNGAYEELVRRETGLQRFAEALERTPLAIRLGLQMQSPGYDVRTTADSQYMYEMYAEQGFVHTDKHEQLTDAILAGPLRDIAASASVDAARHVDVFRDTFTEALQKQPIMDETGLAWHYDRRCALTQRSACQPTAHM
jgi:hypothetical protein